MCNTLESGFTRKFPDYRAERLGDTEKEREGDRSRSRSLPRLQHIASFLLTLSF